MPTALRPTNPRLLGVLLVAALLVLMLLNTRFVTPKELAAAGPKVFNPKATAATLYAKAKAEPDSDATPVADLVGALQQDDPKTVAGKYKGASPSSGTYLFRAKATGTVTAVSAEDLQLRVAGIPKQTVVLVPTSTAVNGTAVRDQLGFKFADAPGQSAYQFVGDELKKLMIAEVRAADPKKGQKVTVVGVISVPDGDSAQPKAKPVSIQPVTVKAGS